MDPNPSLVLSRELGPDERLLWSGVPRQGVFLRRADLFMVPFSLMWGGFAIIWEAMAVTMGAPFFFWLWGIPFVLVGLYMIFGRFLWDARQRAATFYGLTDGNAIIVSGVRTRTVKRLALGSLSDVTLTEGRDGRGTITFGPASPFHSTFGMPGWPGAGRAVPAFDSIENARTVYEMVTRARKAG